MTRTLFSLLLAFGLLGPSSIRAMEPGGHITERTLALAEGENWVHLLLIPGSNTVAEVLDRNQLPSSDMMFNTTRVSWHDPAQAGVATNVLWLDPMTGWRFSGGGSADRYAMPLDQGFSLFIPPGSGSTNLTVREWIPPEKIEGDRFLVTVAPSGAFTMVSMRLAEPVPLIFSGLREAGFTGAPEGEQVNPNNSDELRILQGGGDSLAAPAARILMNDQGEFVFWTGGAFLQNAGDYELQPGQALAIHTTRSTNSLTWKVPIK